MIKESRPTRTDGGNRGKNRSAAPRVDEHAVTEPSTLMEFLLAAYSDRSRTTVKSYLAHGQVAVNGVTKTVFNTPLCVGDVVRVTLGHVEKPFTHKMLRIVYEDDDIIVIDKRNGLLSMATDSERIKTAYYILSDYLKNKDRSARIFIVHRLDRETSGLMLFAKSMDVQHKLQKNWEDMVLERKYVAVVSPPMREEEGVVSSYLAENKAYMVYSTRNPEEGELAVTRFRRLKTNSRYSMVECELETGKKNQIRVHMKDKRSPIIGDKRYGGISSPIGRIALHARRIR
ncbi:MAG: RluA family pseudouridine synthase, partial [Rikenellaceae bacterium]|nr:RluA family pseudouridine synthase [Rikenellaceae bacterium]